MRIEKRVLPSESIAGEIYTCEWSNFHDQWIVSRTCDSFNAPIGDYNACIAHAKSLNFPTLSRPY